MKHNENLQSKISVVRGQLYGKTILPVPAIDDWIERCEVETITLYDNIYILFY